MSRECSDFSGVLARRTRDANGNPRKRLLAALLGHNAIPKGRPLFEGKRKLGTPISRLGDCSATLVSIPSKKWRVGKAPNNRRVVNDWPKPEDLQGWLEVDWEWVV